MFLPTFSGRRANFAAAATAAPEEMPTSSPSWAASSRPASKGLLVFDGDDLVVDSGVQRLGHEPGADALNLVGAGAALGEHGGSGRFHGHHLGWPGSAPSDRPRCPKACRRYPRRPRECPPRHRCPPRSPGRWYARAPAGFAGLENCEGMNEFGISAASRSASSMAPFIPLAPSVSTSSAP